ncbi:MAG: DUF2852 domain-containing protein [Rhizobiales bacterium]|nr:DUF2852 domain-containing protein [Hyphomicrobiales bacterium]
MRHATATSHYDQPQFNRGYSQNGKRRNKRGNRRWSPFNTIAMVLGFVVFWPIGLAMLAYITIGDKMTGRFADARDRMDHFGGKFGRGCGSRRSRSYSSGNMAFDDYRAAELERIEEERRKLDEMRAAFDEHINNLHRAKDQKEFDRFMSKRSEND